MKISCNWLGDWIDLSGLGTEELGHRLTMAGLEVDAVEEIGAGHDDIVVGRIERIDSHPNADRLVLCQVDTGSGKLRQIACGASNMEEGDLVPTALPGSQPPALDFEIAEREMMDEPSLGMLCSAEELGYDSEVDGLWILPEDLEVGTPFFEAMGLRDTVFEIDLTPNRADCLSHLGVARDLSAIFDRPLRQERRNLDWTECLDPSKTAEDAAELTVEDSEGCPRYAFAVLKDIEVGPSPMWLQRRLASIGVRSVNNIVDATNFVLMDVGQPLHAFDLDKLAGPEIVVRRARDGESIEGIDHETYDLDTDDLVIADADRPVAIAGVMGGAATEVTESTSRILLECAFFDPRSVRRTAKRHGLHTDSSHRFERRVDPAGIDRHLDGAIGALVDSLEASESAPMVRKGTVEESVQGVDDGWTVELPGDLATRLLGTDVTPDVVEDCLNRLGLDVSERDEEGWTVGVPSYRGDLERPVDLVEEVARLHGYDTIPETLPEREMGGRHRVRADADHPRTIRSRQARQTEQRMRDELLSLGLQEAVNHSFMSDEELDDLRVPADSELRVSAEIANPLKADERYLRTTLLPGLIRNLTMNRAQRVQDIALFEMGRSHFAAEDGRAGSDNERKQLGVLLAGRARRHWTGDREWDFFDLKGILEATCEAFDLSQSRWEEPADEIPWFHPGVQAEWHVADTPNRPLAQAGRLHPEIVNELEVDGPVLLAELDLDVLWEQGERRAAFEGLARHPSIERDLALVVDTDVTYEVVRRAIEDYRTEDEEFDALLERVELFDVYTGEQVPDGTRSLAFNLVYRADDRTLTEDEVAGVDERLVDHLGDQLDARRR
jgi:phenylalanyl-tRNA synthetase beta chain